MTFLKSVIKSISPNRPYKASRQRGGGKNGGRGGEIVWVRTEILDAAASLEDGDGDNRHNHHGRRRRRGGTAARSPEFEGGGGGDGDSATTWGWARAKLTHKSRQLATERGVEVERYLRITVLPPPPHSESACAGYDLNHVGRRVEIPATPDVDEFVVPANPHDLDDPPPEVVRPILDLADLHHVHEPGVVSELARRFFLLSSKNSDFKSESDRAPSPSPESPPQVMRGGKGKVPPPGSAAAGATYALAGPRVLLSVRPNLHANVGGEAPVVVPSFDSHVDRWADDETLRRYVEFGVGMARHVDGRPHGGEKLPPHVYSIALSAYRSMCEDFADSGKDGGGDRSGGRGGGAPSSEHALLVTGEGGSGRTTANALAVRFLAALSAELRSGSGSGSGSGSSRRRAAGFSSPGNDDGGGGKKVAGALKSEYLDGTSPRSAATLDLMRNYGDDDRDDEAAWGSSSSVPGAACTMEQKVLHAGAILKSFGSAFVGVDRPDSTRHVSCLRLRFGPEHGGGGDGGDVVGGDQPPLLLSGASIEACLLETSRIVGRRRRGRNFHVFHHVLAGVAGSDRGGVQEGETAEEERTRLAERCWLQDARADDFGITRGDDGEDGAASSAASSHGSADLEGYRRLRRAMTVVGFPRSEQEGIISIVCALLHFSNVTAVDSTSHHSAGGFGTGTSDGSGGASELDYENPSLPAALDLLGVTADDLNHVLCSRCVAAGNETHFRSVSAVEAGRTVAGIVRAAYAALFDLLVHSINSSVFVAGGGGGGDSSSIVLVDAFGFEDNGGDGANSFEQLCANYCHEVWMNTCNHLALVAEQEEYRGEEIGWSSIDVPDNRDVLDLLDEKGGLGVLSILEEHCGTPGATDALFVEDLHRRCWDHPRFGAGTGAGARARGREVESGRFTVRHHAGAVEYDVEGFLEKNSGVGGGTTSHPPREATDLFVTSSNALVRRLGNIMMTSGAVAASASDRSSIQGGGGGPTTGGTFATQLRRIRMTIGRCAYGPHLVRCIRPNNRSTASCGSFDYAVVANQVRCAGVVEGIELWRKGFPRHLTHSDFAARYRDLVVAGGGGADLEGGGSSGLTICDRLVSRPPFSDMSRDGVVRVGRRSTVFLTEMAHERLESLLAADRDRRENFGKFHALCRGHLARQEFFITLYCVVMLQSNVRRLIGANRARALREARRAKEVNGVMSSDEVLRMLDRGRLGTDGLVKFITEEVSSLTRLIHSNVSTTKKNGVDASERLSSDENLVHLSPNDDGRNGGLLRQVVLELTSLRGFVRPETDGASQLVGQGLFSVEPRGEKLSGGKTGASSRPHHDSTVASAAVHELQTLRQEIERLIYDAGRAQRDERRTLRDLATLRAAMREMLALKEEGEALRDELRSKGS